MLPHDGCDPHDRFPMFYRHYCPPHPHVDLCVPYDDTALWKAIEDLDQRVGDLEGEYESLKAYVDNALNSILNKIYVPSDSGQQVVAVGNPPAGTISEDGTILWANDARIPTGDLNIWAAEEDPWSTNYKNAIRSRDRSENDLKVV